MVDGSIVALRRVSSGALGSPKISLMNFKGRILRAVKLRSVRVYVKRRNVGRNFLTEDLCQTLH